ncbi:MAG: hypothetical protein JKX95_00005 [Bacteroidia bacterium]|nr:hypothetical protein [Bacteroidia bacterium]
MKKIIFSITAITALMFSACEKDQITEPIKTDNQIQLKKGGQGPNEIALLNILEHVGPNHKMVAKRLLNEAPMSMSVTTKFLEKTASFSGFEQEAVLLASAGYSSEMLIHMINSNMEDDILKNVMVMSNPLSNEVEMELQTKRPHISLPDVSVGPNKQIGFDFHSKQLVIADDITIEETGKNTTVITITNMQTRPMAKTASNNEHETLKDGCGGSKWVCGIQSMIHHAGDRTTLTCYGKTEKCFKDRVN